MHIGELLDAAKRARGTFGALAEDLGCHQNRFGEWRKGTRKPDAGEIVQLAEIAGLPPLSTLAEIQAQLDEKHSAVWRSALGKLTAAGIAASMVMGVTLIPDRANATQTAGTVRPEPTAPVAPSPSQVRHAQSVYYVNLLKRLLSRLFGRSRAVVQFR